MTKTMYDKSSIRITGESPQDAVEKFAEFDARDLAELIVNDQLNDFIADRSSSSFSDDRMEAPIPYQGWFWRSVDFFSPRGVTIAEGDGQVAVCENNKWDYPQRDLTDAEQAEFLALVWVAYQANRAGGNLAEIRKTTDEALARAGEFIAGLAVSDD